MKAITYLLIVLSVSGFALSAYSQWELSSAELRTENYRQMYEKCDEHHDCKSQTNYTQQSKKMGSRSGAVKPPMHFSLWG